MIAYPAAPIDPLPLVVFGLCLVAGILGYGVRLLMEWGERHYHGDLYCSGCGKVVAHLGPKTSVVPRAEQEVG